MCLAVLVLLLLPPEKCHSQRHSFNVSLLVGNQANNRAEVYRLSFLCSDNTCHPKSVGREDLQWSSPSVGSISEVKRVLYGGFDAILATSGNGAVVFSYPDGRVLFNRQLKGVDLGVHSAEVLPDGNVAVIGSYGNAVMVLRPSGKPYQFQSALETITFPIRYGHGLTYDIRGDRLFALGYLTLFVLKYRGKNGGEMESLQLVTSVPFDLFYFSPDHNEDFDTEDGGHDLYPVDGEENLLYLTTGERVFLLNVTSLQLSYHPGLSYIWSRHGSSLNLTVRLKGGVKSISRDSDNKGSLVHSAPWFKELFNVITGDDQNYLPQTSHVMWTLEDGQCVSPDFDFTKDCKIPFSFPEIYFYKARVFRTPTFSYADPFELLYQQSPQSSDMINDSASSIRDSIIIPKTVSVARSSLSRFLHGAHVTVVLVTLAGLITI